MLLSEFCLSAIEHIQQGNYGIKPVVRLYTDGFQSSDPAELAFIHSSNIKYHQTESDTLIGTYFDISWETSGPTRPMCRIESAYLMGMYQTGGWESVDRVVQANIDHAKMIDGSVLNHMDDYDMVRDYLILRPIPYEQNRLALKDHLFQKIGDIVLALYIKVRDNGDELLSAKVPKSVVEGWGIPEEKILAAAMENTALLYPPRIYLTPFELKNPPYMRGVFMGDGEGRVTSIDQKIDATLTTTRQLNGAIAIFYPGVQERIAELYGGSYYAAFTSSSEVVIHSVKAISAWQVYKALKNSNRRFRSSMISNSVYLYDADKKLFEKLDI